MRRRRTGETTASRRSVRRQVAAAYGWRGSRQRAVTDCRRAVGGKLFPQGPMSAVGGQGALLAAKIAVDTHVSPGLPHADVQGVNLNVVANVSLHRRLGKHRARCNELRYGHAALAERADHLGECRDGVVSVLTALVVLHEDPVLLVASDAIGRVLDDDGLVKAPAEGSEVLAVACLAGEPLRMAVNTVLHDAMLVDAPDDGLGVRLEAGSPDAHFAAILAAREKLVQTRAGVQRAFAREHKRLVQVKDEHDLVTVGGVLVGDAELRRVMAHRRRAGAAGSGTARSATSLVLRLEGRAAESLTLRGCHGCRLSRARVCSARERFEAGS
mmetsp:Transcript_22627/g.70164  ORF Transcript_22627/g.70164 Transcript_22627/m.70164 type:complete len:328 (-) Transcript_22627:140-1123(-)